MDPAATADRVYRTRDTTSGGAPRRSGTATALRPAGRNSSHEQLPDLLLAQRLDNDGCEILVQSSCRFPSLLLGCLRQRLHTRPCRGRIQRELTLEDRLEEILIRESRLHKIVTLSVGVQRLCAPEQTRES